MDPQNLPQNTPIVPNIDPNIGDISEMDLTDITGAYDQMSQGIDLMGQNSLADIAGRQQQLIGNNFGTPAEGPMGSYNENTYISPAVSSGRSTVQQIGTQVALSEGIRRSEEAAEEQLKATQKKYNEWVAEQNRKAAQAQADANAANQAALNATKVQNNTISQETLDKHGLSLEDFGVLDEGARTKLLQEDYERRTGFDWDYKGDDWYATVDRLYKEFGVSGAAAKDERSGNQTQANKDFWKRADVSKRFGEVHAEIQGYGDGAQYWKTRQEYVRQGNIAIERWINPKTAEDKAISFDKLMRSIDVVLPTKEYEVTEKNLGAVSALKERMAAYERGGSQNQLSQEERNELARINKDFQGNGEANVSRMMELLDKAGSHTQLEEVDQGFFGGIFNAPKYRVVGDEKIVDRRFNAASILESALGLTKEELEGMRSIKQKDSREFERILKIANRVIGGNYMTMSDGEDKPDNYYRDSTGELKLAENGEVILHYMPGAENDPALADLRKYIKDPLYMESIHKATAGEELNEEEAKRVKHFEDAYTKLRNNQIMAAAVAEGRDLTENSDIYSAVMYDADENSATGSNEINGRRISEWMHEFRTLARDDKDLMNEQYLDLIDKANRSQGGFATADGGFQELNREEDGGRSSIGAPRKHFQDLTDEQALALLLVIKKEQDAGQFDGSFLDKNPGADSGIGDHIAWAGANLINGIGAATGLLTGGWMDITGEKDTWGGNLMRGSVNRIINPKREDFGGAQRYDELAYDTFRQILDVQYNADVSGEEGWYGKDSDFWVGAKRFGGVSAGFVADIGLGFATGGAAKYLSVGIARKSAAKIASSYASNLGRSVGESVSSKAIRDASGNLGIRTTAGEFKTFEEIGTDLATAAMNGRGATQYLKELNPTVFKGLDETKVAKMISDSMPKGLMGLEARNRLIQANLRQANANIAGATALMVNGVSSKSIAMASPQALRAAVRVIQQGGKNGDTVFSDASRRAVIDRAEKQIAKLSDELTRGTNAAGKTLSTTEKRSLRSKIAAQKRRIANSGAPSIAREYGFQTNAQVAKKLVDRSAEMAERGRTMSKYEVAKFLSREGSDSARKQAFISRFLRDEALGNALFVWGDQRGAIDLHTGEHRWEDPGYVVEALVLGSTLGIGIHTLGGPTQSLKRQVVNTRIQRIQSNLLKNAADPTNKAYVRQMNKLARLTRQADRLMDDALTYAGNPDAVALFKRSAEDAKAASRQVLDALQEVKGFSDTAMAKSAKELIEAVMGKANYENRLVSTMTMLRGTAHNDYVTRTAAMRNIAGITDEKANAAILKSGFDSMKAARAASKKPLTVAQADKAMDAGLVEGLVKYGINRETAEREIRFLRSEYKRIWKEIEAKSKEGVIDLKSFGSRDRGGYISPAGITHTMVDDMAPSDWGLIFERKVNADISEPIYSRQADMGETIDAWINGKRHGKGIMKVRNPEGFNLLTGLHTYSNVVNSRMYLATLDHNIIKNGDMLVVGSKNIANAISEDRKFYTDRAKQLKAEIKALKAETRSAAEGAQITAKRAEVQEIETRLSELEGVGLDADTVRVAAETLNTTPEEFSKVYRRIADGLYKNKQAILRGKETGVVKSDIEDEIQQILGHTLTESETETMIRNFKRRFGDEKFRILSKDQANAMGHTEARGFYRVAEDLIHLIDGRATMRVADHEQIHRAVNLFLDDTQKADLLRAVVELNGGKTALLKKYRRSGYPKIEWEGAAEEELANMFAEYANKGSLKPFRRLQRDAVDIKQRLTWLVEDLFAAIEVRARRMMAIVRASDSDSATETLKTFYDEFNSGMLANQRRNQMQEDVGIFSEQYRRIESRTPDDFETQMFGPGSLFDGQPYMRSNSMDDIMGGPETAADRNLRNELEHIESLEEFNTRFDQLDSEDQMLYHNLWYSRNYPSENTPSSPNDTKFSIDDGSTDAPIKGLEQFTDGRGNYTRDNVLEATFRHFDNTQPLYAADGVGGIADEAGSQYMQGVDDIAQATLLMRVGNDDYSRALLNETRRKFAEADGGANIYGLGDVVQEMAEKTPLSKKPGDGLDSLEWRKTSNALTYDTADNVLATVKKDYQPGTALHTLAEALDEPRLGAVKLERSVDEFDVEDSGFGLEYVASKMEQFQRFTTAEKQEALEALDFLLRDGGKSAGEKSEATVRRQFNLREIAAKNNLDDPNFDETPMFSRITDPENPTSSQVGNRRQLIEEEYERVSGQYTTEGSIPSYEDMMREAAANVDARLMKEGFTPEDDQALRSVVLARQTELKESLNNILDESFYASDFDDYLARYGYDNPDKHSLDLQADLIREMDDVLRDLNGLDGELDNFNPELMSAFRGRVQEIREELAAPTYQAQGPANLGQVKIGKNSYDAVPLTEGGAIVPGARATSSDRPIASGAGMERWAQAESDEVNKILKANLSKDQFEEYTVDLDPARAIGSGNEAGRDEQVSPFSSEIRELIEDLRVARDNKEISAKAFSNVESRLSSKLRVTDEQIDPLDSVDEVDAEINRLAEANASGRVQRAERPGQERRISRTPGARLGHFYRAIGSEAGLEAEQKALRASLRDSKKELNTMVKAKQKAAIESANDAAKPLMRELVEVNEKLGQIKAAGRNPEAYINRNGLRYVANANGLQGYSSAQTLTDLEIAKRQSPGIRNVLDNSRIRRDNKRKGAVTKATSDSREAAYKELTGTVRSAGSVMDDSDIMIHQSLAKVRSVEHHQFSTKQTLDRMLLATSGFAKAIQNVQLSAGYSRYNAYSFRFLLSALMSDPRNAGPLLKTLRDSRSIESVNEFYIHNQELFIDVAHKTGDPFYMQLFSDSVSQSAEFDTGYLARLAKAPGRNARYVEKMDRIPRERREELAEAQGLDSWRNTPTHEATTAVAVEASAPRHLYKTVANAVETTFDDPTFKRYMPVLAGTMYMQNYRRAIEIAKVKVRKHATAQAKREGRDVEVSELMLTQDEIDFAIMQAHVRTKLFFHPSSTSGMGIKEIKRIVAEGNYDEKAINAFFNKLKRDQIDEITGANDGKNMGKIIQSLFFALAYKATQLGQMVNGVAGIGQLARARVGGESTSLVLEGSRNMVGTMLGLTAAAIVYNEVNGRPQGWDDPARLLSNLNELGKFRLGDGDGSPAIDPYFSQFTLLNSGIRMAMGVAGMEGGSGVGKSNPHRGIGIPGTSAYIRGNLPFRLGAIQDELTANLLSPFKAVAEVMTNNTYFGGNIWEHPTKLDGTPNKNYNPLRNMMASAWHLMGFDTTNAMVKGENLENDDISWVGGSGLLQHPYLSAFKSWQKGDYAAAMFEALEMPIKWDNLPGRARSSLNGYVLDTIGQLKQDYDAVVAANEGNKDAIDAAYESYTKQSVQVISEWSKTHGDVLENDPRLVAAAQRIMTGFFADQYDDNLMKMQSAYWRASIESGLGTDFGWHDMMPHETEDQFLERKEKTSAAFFAERDKEYEARKELERLGFDTGDRWASSDDYTTYRGTHRNVISQFESLVYGKVEGYYDLRAEKKSYEERIKLVDSVYTNKTKATERKTQMAEEHNQKVFDILRPYVEQYGPYTLEMYDRSGGKSLGSVAAELLIIPADQLWKYALNKTPERNYLKDQFGVGYRNNSNLPSDPEYRRKFEQVNKRMQKGQIASASTLLNDIIKSVQSGKYGVAGQDWARTLRYREIINGRMGL